MSSLVELGCTIPQAWGNSEPHNVVTGKFADPSQTDWAALCSQDGESELVVIWGGSASCPTPLARWPDRHFLQNVGVDGILFSRIIGAAPGNLMSTFWKYAGQGDPPALAHDYLSDAFYEKCAKAYYCHEGRWIEFTSGD